MKKDKVVKEVVEEPVVKPPKRLVRDKEPVHEDVQAQLIERSKFDEFFTFFQFIFFGTIIAGSIYGHTITTTVNEEVKRQQQEEKEYQEKAEELKKQKEAVKQEQENKGIEGTAYEDLSKLSYSDRLTVKKIMNLDVYDTPEINKAIDSYVSAVASDTSYAFDGSILSPMDGEQWVQSGAWEVDVASFSYNEKRRVLTLDLRIKNEGIEKGIELQEGDFTLYSYDSDDLSLDTHRLITIDTPVDEELGYIPVEDEETGYLTPTPTPTPSPTPTQVPTAISETDVKESSDYKIIKESTLLNEVVPIGHEKEGTLVFNMNELTSVLQARNLCLQVKMYDENKEKQISELFFLSRTFNKSGDE